jgi:hypothetical protein
MSEQEQMQIRLKRVEGTEDEPVPFVEAVSIPDPLYGGAKMKTVLLDPAVSDMLVTEDVAHAIFSNPFTAGSFEVHPNSKAIPKILYTDEDWKREWDASRESEKKSSTKKAESKK